MPFSKAGWFDGKNWSEPNLNLDNSDLKFFFMHNGLHYFPDKLPVVFIVKWRTETCHALIGWR